MREAAALLKTPSVRPLLPCLPPFLPPSRAACARISMSTVHDSLALVQQRTQCRRRITLSVSHRCAPCGWPCSIRWICSGLTADVPADVPHCRRLITLSACYTPVWFTLLIFARRTFLAAEEHWNKAGFSGCRIVNEKLGGVVEWACNALFHCIPFPPHPAPSHTSLFHSLICRRLHEEL